MLATQPPNLITSANDYDLIRDNPTRMIKREKFLHVSHLHALENSIRHTHAATPYKRPQSVILLGFWRGLRFAKAKLIVEDED